MMNVFMYSLVDYSDSDYICFAVWVDLVARKLHTVQLYLHGRQQVAIVDGKFQRSHYDGLMLLQHSGFSMIGQKSNGNLEAELPKYVQQFRTALSEASKYAAEEFNSRK